MKVEKERGLFQTRYVLTKKKREGHLLHTQVSWGKRKGAGFVFLLLFSIPSSFSF